MDITDPKEVVPPFDINGDADVSASKRPINRALLLRWRALAIMSILAEQEEDTILVG